MPTVSVGRSVTLEETIAALTDELGGRYTFSPGGSDSFTVKTSAMSVAKVKVNPEGGGTEFDVKGGGFLLTIRAKNSRGIAHDVANAIEQSARLR